jgi:hypothetical protein
MIQIYHNYNENIEFFFFIRTGYILHKVSKNFRLLRGSRETSL